MVSVAILLLWSCTSLRYPVWFYQLLCLDFHQRPEDGLLGWIRRCVWAIRRMGRWCWRHWIGWWNVDQLHFFHLQPVNEYQNKKEVWIFWVVLCNSDNEELKLTFIVYMIHCVLASPSTTGFALHKFVLVIQRYWEAVSYLCQNHFSLGKSNLPAGQQPRRGFFHSGAMESLYLHP